VFAGISEQGMDELPRVTVVIPAYKAERTIRRAVESVLAQQGVAVRVIVVVDGRLDATAERLAGYDARVTILVNERNRGAQVSRNRGLAEAPDPFIMFLDCDDFIEGPLLRSLADAIAAAGADMAIGPMQVLKEEQGRRLPTVHVTFGSPAELFWNWMAHARLVAPCSILWRTEFVRQIGGWDEAVQRNQDGELAMRAVLGGARVTRSDQGRGVYVHHQSEDRITKRPDVLEWRLRVGEMILALPSNAVPEDEKRGAVARYFYRVALNCHSRGQPGLAQRALARSRELGFRGHLGPLWHRIPAMLLGVGLRYRLTNFIKQHRVFGFRGL
jgi:glycosyltransferase involved in cell wall biosynthesis